MLKSHRIQIERDTAPKAELRVRLATLLAMGLAALLCAGSASADLIYSLTIGTTFNSGSAIALGTSVGLYTGTHDLAVTSTPIVPKDLAIDIAGIDPMPSVQPPLDPSVFRFSLAANPQLTFDTIAGTINGALTDADVQIDVERWISADLIGSDSYLAPFTTGTISFPACGGAAARDISGSYVDNDPNDGVIDEVVLVAAVCMSDFGTVTGFNQPLELRLRGTLTVICPPGTDDGVSCTVDGCDPYSLEIINTPYDSLCDDDDVCNGVETCDALLDCQLCTPPVVDDGVVCTVDICDPVTGVSNTPDHGVCDDSDVCTGLESCDSVLDCQTTGPLVVNDGLDCTIDTCDPVLGVSNTPDDSICMDGDLCNGNEFCHAILDCSPGPPPTIDDGVACTLDSCDPILGVVNAPDHSSCADSTLCNGAEICDLLLDCQPGPPVVVDDGVGCTVDSCDPATGAVHTPDDSHCNDSDVCNGAETCNLLLDCQAGTPLDVFDDGIGCTTDSCDAILGLLNTPDHSACDDGDLCTGSESCDAALDCLPGTPPVIDDGIGCTIDTCNPVLGVVHAPDDPQCTDGNACNGTEICHPSLDCQNGAPPVLDDGIGCTIDTCAALTGVAHTPYDLLCSDNDVCTGFEACDPLNDCQPGVPLVVDDGVACTVDSCGPGGVISNVPSDALCDDSDVCTGVETCDAVQDCQAGTPLATDDSVDCTIDTCDPVTGVVANTPDDSACSDGNLCTGIEACSPSLGCQAGTPPVVDDGISCTIDSCAALVGVLNIPIDSACNDDDVCTGFEVCNPAVGCQSPSPLNCDDTNECTDDGCDPGAGCVFTDNTAPCDDGGACTAADTCAGGACIAGPALNCDDGNLCTADGCDGITGCFNEPIPECVVSVPALSIHALLALGTIVALLGGHLVGRNERRQR